MFNPFVDFSNLNLEQLHEKKAELQKKIMTIRNDRIRDQISAMINQLDLMIYEKYTLQKQKELEESDDYNDSISIG
jgi:hypothetical protein|tara:strand:- start:330 stop:557 length:228 start_codon:yes stop_codon:yes gene_type:complete